MPTLAPLSSLFAFVRLAIFVPLLMLRVWWPGNGGARGMGRLGGRDCGSRHRHWHRHCRWRRPLDVMMATTTPFRMLLGQ